jgi:xylulokinase
MGEILGMPLGIHPYPTEATAMGAALAAGISVGLWKNMHDAIACVGWKTGETLPDPVHVEAYRKVYAIYREVYPALRNMYRQLAEVRNIHA